jgi:prepilin-type N-terminal cleavage/methylation domain-containing protein
VVSKVHPLSRAVGTRTPAEFHTAWLPRSIPKPNFLDRTNEVSGITIARFWCGRQKAIVNNKEMFNPASATFTPHQSERLIHMQLNTSRRSAFTLVEIMIVVAIIGLLAAIAIPNFIKAREASQKNACIANLKQIDGAKQTWALETKQISTALPDATEIYGATLYIRDTPSCPANGSYDILTVSEKPTCTIEGHSI